MRRISRAGAVIWLVVGIVCLCVVAIGMLLVHQVTREAESAARHQTESVARAAESGLNRNLITFDLMLAGLATMPGLFVDSRGSVDAKLAPALLRSLIDQRLVVQNLTIFDADGKIVAAARESTQRLGQSLSEELFRSVKSQVVPKLAVSLPVADFGTAQKVIHFARPLIFDGGERRIVVATVPVSALTTIMAPAVEIEGMTLVMENDAGVVLATVPANDSLLGRALSKTPPAPSDVSSRGASAGRLTGKPVFATTRSTVYGSVLVTAETSEASALAPTRQRRLATVAVGAGFIALVVALAVLSQAYLRQVKGVAEEAANARFVLEEALASMDEGFLLWNADDEVIAWNGRYLAMFEHLRGVIEIGMSIEEVARVASVAMVPSGDAERRRAWAAARVADHQAASGREVEQRLPDGKVIGVVERRTATGGIVAIYRDVTEARAAARELEQAMRRAEEANVAKTRFLATMSHEIRTPLNGVLGMNSLLLNSPLNPKQRLYAETIRNSGEALLDIINDILDVSRLEAGRVALEAVPFDPARLIDEVVAPLGSRAVAKGIALSVDHGPEPPWLVGDAARLRQVLFNLVGNAIKFTERGSVVVESTHRPLDDGRIEWSVRVCDTGIGIAPEAIPTLFDRFTQADSSTSRRFGGSGLGLAICRELVDLMGGRIVVDSRLDAGSRIGIVVALPVAAGASAGRAPATADPPSEAGRALRILVAEDNGVNQMLIAAMLQQMGHEVDLVTDGRQALEQVRRSRYDVVLMDIQMPQMDGVTATREIRRLPGPAGDVPIVAVSANVLPEQREAYLAAGMNDHVTKPIDQRLLARAIAAAVGPAATADGLAESWIQAPAKA